jgi:peroxiredoxin
MKALTSIILVAALAAFTASLAAGETKAPGFSAVDHNGKEHSLDQYRGKVVVLEWINPDCPFVQRHYREGTMKALDGRFEDQGVVWLAVNSTNYHDASRNKEWAEKYSLPYPILVDKEGTIGRLYGAKTTPHMFVVNRNGELVYSGAVDDDAGGNKDKRDVYVLSAIQAALAGSLPARQETKPYGCSVKYAD